MDPKLGELTNSAWALDEKLKEPAQYKVILLNDDYTTKEFVAEILMAVFHKTEPEAISLMEKVHAVGSAAVGVYSYDIATTLISMTVQVARKKGFPLQCKLEEC